MRRFVDRVTPGVDHVFETERVIVEERTAHQYLALFEHRLFGTVLILDGAVQLTTADEYVYHEMLAHVPILAHGAVRDVLIVGGGDGGLAARVLQHPGVRSVTLVEIDEAVVSFAKRHFQAMNAAAFADPRLEVVVADGTVFAATTERRFDAILVDSTDPVGPAKVLFEVPFYQDVRRCLRPEGVVAIQAGVPFIQPAEFTTALGNLRTVFAGAVPYLCTVPTYFGGQMALGYAGPVDVPPDLLAERFRSVGGTTRYYTPEVHRAAFALPPFIRDLLRAAG